MIDVRVRITGGEGFREKVDLIARPDLMPLAAIVAPILEAGCVRDRLAGMGRFGAFAPLRTGTYERRARAGKGAGPPLVPDDEASRFARMETEIVQLAENSVLVLGGWPGTEAFIQYHIDGTRHMAARDPVFISEETMAECQAAIRDYFLDLIARANP